MLFQALLGGNTRQDSMRMHFLLNNQEPQAKQVMKKTKLSFYVLVRALQIKNAFKDVLSHTFSLSIFLFITFPADAPLQQTPRILSVVPL